MACSPIRRRDTRPCSSASGPKKPSTSRSGRTDRHQTITWGAAQLGVGQGVLDAVADGLIEATGDLVVLVAVWVDPDAVDETAVRIANRQAVRKAIATCVQGRDPEAAARLVAERDRLRNPFYSGD